MPHSRMPLVLPFAGMTIIIDHRRHVGRYINTSCVAVCTESIHNNVYARYYVLACAGP